MLLSGGVALAQSSANQPQSSGKQAKASEEANKKASAYYNFAMGHLYSDLGAAYGNRGEYFNRAIDFYKKALQDDPNAGFLAEEISDLYVQSGRLSDAVREAEATLKTNPNDLTARRLLGRLYARMIGDPQTRTINQSMLKNAIEQYQKVTAIDAGDVDAWMMLGRLQKIAQNSVEAKKAYQAVLAKDPENVDALSGLALVLADVGDTNGAAELLKKVAEKSPNLRTFTALAAAYEQMRDYNSAAMTMKRAVDMQPENGELRRDYANLLVQAKRYDEAITVFKEIVTDEPRDVQSLLRLSQLHQEVNQIDEAWAANKKAKELDPGNVEIRYNEAGLYEAQGKVPEAITALKDVLVSTGRGGSSAEKGNRAMLLERLGLLYRGNDQTAEAIASFKEMGELDKEYAARSLAQMADTYRQGKQSQKALETADEGLKRFPNDRLLVTIRATTLAEMGRSAEASTEMKKLLGGKSDRDVYLQLAQIYDKAKNYGEMAKALDTAEKLSSQQEEKVQVWFSRGAMLERQKKFDEAEKEFRRVIEAEPNNAGALNYLGYMFADRGVRLTEAHDLISKALKQDPGNGAYLDSLGWVLYKQGKLSEAAKMLEEATAKVPRDPTIQDHLADVYFKMNRVKDAVAAWQKSVKEWESSPQAEREAMDITKVQKKLEGAKVRLAKESGNARKPQ